MPLDLCALMVATIVVAATLFTVPSWSGIATDPCRLAAVAACATMVVLYVTRARGRRGIALERWCLAAFLIGMPLVYIARWILHSDASATWLYVELAALPLFGSLAWLGLRRSPYYMAAGIAAHGVAWDAWHHGSTYIPSWYATACLVIDLSLGLYVALRAPAWRASASVVA